MHPTLTALQEKLNGIIAQIGNVMPNDEPLGIAHGSWNIPGLTRSELIGKAQHLIDFVSDNETDDLGDYDAQLNDYLRRLQHLHSSTVPQFWSGNAGQAVPAYVLTLDGLEHVLRLALTRDDRAEVSASLRRLANKIRGLESLFKQVEPRTTSLVEMVKRIEQAYEAADQLPTDLESLSEARQKIDGLNQEAAKDHSRLLRILEHAEELDELMRSSAENAKSVLQRCETAYSAATSVGLAAAFSERSSALSKTMWVWVVGLIFSLGAGGYFGSRQLHSLLELFNRPDVSPLVINLNIILSLLTVGSPVWFAWLATKQIGQRFRLAEDYAFKASISRAYEGFRRETARFDKDMEAKLLASALTRLDELPLRLVEPDSHRSPWHELASSDIVKQALKTIPGFSCQVKDLASAAISAIPCAKSKQKSADILSTSVPPGKDDQVS